VLGRSPSTAEIDRAVRFLAETCQTPSSTADIPDRQTDVRVRDWAGLCQVLFASNEFFYVN